MRLLHRPLALASLALALAGCSNSLSTEERTAVRQDALTFMTGPREQLGDAFSLFWVFERDEVLPTMSPEEALDVIEAREDTECEVYTRATSTTLRLERGPQLNGCYGAVDSGTLYTLTASRDAAGELELSVLAELADGSTWTARRVVRASAEPSPFELEAPSLSFKGTTRRAARSSRFMLDGTGEARWSDAAARPYRMEQLILLFGTCAPFYGDLVVEYQDGLEYPDLDHPGRTQRIDGPLEASLHFEADLVALTLEGKREALYYDELRCSAPWSF